MEIKVHEVNPVKKKIAITVGPEKIRTAFDDAVGRYRRQAKLKGFRPGKAPVSMVRQLYYDQIRMEVMEGLVDESFRAALEETAFIPLAMPEIENLSFADDNDYLTYEAVIELKPKFDFDGYLGIELSRQPAEVTADDIAEGLENLRRMYAQYRTVDDRPAQEGDTVVIDFVGRVDGEEFAGGSAEGHSVEIGSGRLIPDLENQLSGFGRGETRDLSVTFPDDYHNPDLAGRDAVFTVTVQEIKEKVLPEVDDDFAADVSSGELTTVAQLREKMTEGIASRKEEMARRKTIEDLLARLREMVDFDLPEIMVEEEKRSMAQAMRTRFLSQGIEQEMADRMVAANRERIELEALEAVKNTLILEYLAEREEIECTGNDLNEQLRKLMVQSGQNPQIMRERFEGREAELESMLHTQAVMDKVIDHLLEHVTYVEP
ncbi:MAG: trigger factor [Deltaproteobacteria bacterium]|nr:trigger factor [Candidatus Anaeroferrophillacea bacterium]